MRPSGLFTRSEGAPVLEFFAQSSDLHSDFEHTFAADA